MAADLQVSSLYFRTHLFLCTCTLYTVQCRVADCGIFIIAAKLGTRLKLLNPVGYKLSYGVLFIRLQHILGKHIHKNL